MLDLTDIPNHEKNLPGNSFANYLRGEQPPEYQDVVIYDEYGPVRMIRTAEQKYVHRHPDGPHEFYDLIHDPDELENRINDDSFAPQIQSLRTRLEQWFARFVDPHIDGTKEAVYGKGQIDRAGTPANYADDIHFYKDQNAFKEEA